MTEPSDQTPTETQPDADQLLRELTETKKTLAVERETMGHLQKSFVDAVAASQNAVPAPPPPEPEPDDIPTPEDFDNDHAQSTARLAATMIKRGLSEYHQTQSGDNAELRDAVLTMEWDKVRAEDSKNFDRLSKHINKALQTPGARRPGAIRNIFYSLRGQYMPQLQEMDRKDRLSEPVPEPNPPTGGDSKPEPSFTRLNGEEISVIKGMGVNVKEYYTNKYGKAPEFEEGYLRGLGLPEEAAP